MTTEFIDLKEMQTAADALSLVRKRAPFTETIYSLYVTDKERHLTGILSLRDLVTADPSKPIGEVMTRDVVNISTNTNQEEVARAIQRYDFLALPVVDKEKRLVGIVTVDDLIDVIEQEATRDIYAAGAVQPGDEDDYFQSSLFTIARRRILWLLILVLANGLTTKVIAMNDQILKEIVLLAAFIPLLIGTGGNVGAQSSTVVIRGLSTQKLKSLGAIKAVVKEAITGALLGVFMMLVVFPFAWWQGEGPLIASAVGISLISITTLAATTGAILPLLFDRMKLDPALMSSPFITTVTDIAGVFIYALIVSTKILFGSMYSGLAGGMALSILMLPTVIKTTDEGLKLVPNELRYASLGVGASMYTTILKVTLPSAFRSIATGVVLGIARAAGETAPLIFTALFSYYYIVGFEDLFYEMGSLAVLIYNFALEPYDAQNKLAWAASFILVLSILSVNIFSRILAAFTENTKRV